MFTPNLNGKTKRSKDLESYWHQKFEASAAFSSDADRNLAHSFGHKERLLVFKELIQKYLHPGAQSVLDVGCGSGTYFDLYDAMGLEIKGIDFSDAQIERARKRNANAHLFAGFVEAAPDSFTADLVVSIGVVQAVSDLDLFFHSFANRVLPGGMAIVSCLNKRSIWPGSILDPKLRFFSYSTISSMLEKHFHIVDCRRFYPMPFPFSLARPLLYKFQIPFLNHGFMFVLKPRSVALNDEGDQNLG